MFQASSAPPAVQPSVTVVAVISETVSIVGTWQSGFISTVKSSKFQEQLPVAEVKRKVMRAPSGTFSPKVNGP